jgi:hypothetical protein
MFNFFGCLFENKHFEPRLPIPFCRFLLYLSVMRFFAGMLLLLYFGARVVPASLQGLACTIFWALPKH